MKILMIGDIYGRTGRDAVEKHLPALRKAHAIDLVIANCDNAAHGIGITPPIARDLYDLGIDLLTGGDHVWDKHDMVPHLDREPIVLRPMNFPEGTPGKFFHILRTKNNQEVLVVHAQGRTFHRELSENPFLMIEKFLTKYPLGQKIAAIVMDFHAITTSEKMVMAHIVDGRISALLGTHTHVPTADARILPKGTAFMTDVGMTGDYDSVIGAEKSIMINTLRTGLKFERLKPAEGEATLCGAVVEIDDATGLAKSITPIRVGGILGV
jgi:metallophosphoesterase (TIGR00282 family)